MVYGKKPNLLSFHRFEGKNCNILIPIKSVLEISTHFTATSINDNIIIQHFGGISSISIYPFVRSPLHMGCPWDLQLSHTNYCHNSQYMIPKENSNVFSCSQTYFLARHWQCQHTTIYASIWFSNYGSQSTPGTDVKNAEIGRKATKMIDKVLN